MALVVLSKIEQSGRGPCRAAGRLGGQGRFGTISMDGRRCYAGWSKPMLAALLALVPRSERVLIAEDSRELALDPPHAIRLEGRPPNW